jgi:hypothetical protein
MLQDMSALYREVLKARLEMISGTTFAKQSHLDPSVFVQQEIDFSQAVFRFLSSRDSASALDSDDEELLDRIIEDAGKRRRMKQKYAEYLATKGDAKEGRDSKLEAKLAEDA